MVLGPRPGNSGAWTSEVIDLCGSDTEEDKPASKRPRVHGRDGSAVAHFIETTGVDVSVARFFVENAKGDLERAIDSFFDSGTEPQRVCADGRLRWHPEQGSVDAWTAGVPPSRVSLQEADWLQLHNPDAASPGFDRTPAGRFQRSAYEPILARQEAAAKRSTQAAKQQEAATIQELLHVAKAQGVTTGKWMLLVKADAVDAVWSLVARATARGELGCSAKVAPARGAALGSQLLLCVYVCDLNVRAEVRRVLLRLQGLLSQDGPLGASHQVLTVGFESILPCPLPLSPSLSLSLPLSLPLSLCLSLSLPLSLFLPLSPRSL